MTTPRRSFIRTALTALAGLACAPFLKAQPKPPILAPVRPQLQLRRAIIWGRRVPGSAGPIYAASFAELQPGDVFTIINEDKTDPDHLTMWRVQDGPFPTSDPATMGPSYVVVEAVRC